MKAVYLITAVAMLSGRAGGGNVAMDAYSPAPLGARQLSGTEICSQIVGV